MDYVVMEGKEYLQLGGKDICDLLEETLVVKFWEILMVKFRGY